MKKRLFIFLILPIIVSTFLLSCGAGSKDSKKGQLTAGEDSSEKSSDDLNKLEESIEKIFFILEGPFVDPESKMGNLEGGQQQASSESKSQSDEKNNQNQGNQKQNDQKQGDQSNSSDTSGGGNKSSQESQNQPGNQAQSNKGDPWTKISPVISKLHYQWNNYTPKAARMNANKSLLDNFGNSLNNLTNATASKNKINTMLAANSLYMYIPDLYDLYKGNSLSNIKKIRYYIRNTMLNSMVSNWSEANSDMSTLKSVWSIYKNTVSQKQQDISGRLDFSISELEKVLYEKKQGLINIKGLVALSNVGQFEKENKQ